MSLKNFLLWTGSQPKNGGGLQQDPLKNSPGMAAFIDESVQYFALSSLPGSVS